MKKIIITLILVSMLLCGCKAEVRSEQELLAYVNARYGSCTLVGSDKSSDRELVCTVRDDKYGFTYTVTSRVSDVGMDGTKFWESESTTDDHLPCLTDYIIKNEDSRLKEIEKKYSLSIEDSYPSHYLISLILQSENAQSAEEAAAGTAAIFKEYDSGRVFQSYSVAVYDSRKELIGLCDMYTGKWTTAEEVNIEFYAEKARRLDRSSVYLRNESKTFGDMGVQLSDVNNPMWDKDLITDNSSKVTCYYFEAGSKEFFIADFYVKRIDNIDGFYTNFYSVFGEGSSM